MVTFRIDLPSDFCNRHVAATCVAGDSVIDIRLHFNETGRENVDGRGLVRTSRGRISPGRATAAYNNNMTRRRPGRAFHRHSPTVKFFV